MIDSLSPRQTLILAVLAVPAALMLWVWAASLRRRLAQSRDRSETLSRLHWMDRDQADSSASVGEEPFVPTDPDVGIEDIDQHLHHDRRN
mgnify:CR=1 FL=1